MIDYYGLTSIEQYQNVSFKRDDLFKPFDDFGITGGKVRQCLFLVEENLIRIKSDFNGTIGTAASVHSPQAVIVARVAREFGLRCIIGHGAKEPRKHRAMLECERLGAELVCLTEHNAFNNVLYARLADLNKTRKFFTINFGYQVSTNPEAIIDMNAYQVQNLPDDLDMLVVNVGSGVSSVGILHGIKRYKPYLLKDQLVHFIQPFGYDRQDMMLRALELGERINYHKGDYQYHTPFHVKIDGLELDQIYEAKAYDYMLENLVPSWWLKPDSGKKVCFWIIGNSNVLRS